MNKEKMGEARKIIRSWKKKDLFKFLEESIEYMYESEYIGILVKCDDEEEPYSCIYYHGNGEDVGPRLYYKNGEVK